MKSQRKIMNTYPLIPNKKMIMVDELKSLGLSTYKINQIATSGKLQKLTKRFYENMDYTGEDSDFYYAYAYVPNGVVCLMSAAVYYGLSTFRPDSVDVAIPRKSRVKTLPDWPAIRLHYYSDERFHLGIDTIYDDLNCFRIYDIEKTVADVISFREKIGIEETKEILCAYLSREDRKLNKLVRYADALKCGDILRKYLEVLV